MKQQYRIKQVKHANKAVCCRKYLEIRNSNSTFVKVLSLIHCFLSLNTPLSKWCERMLNKISFQKRPSSTLLLTSLIKCFFCFLCLSDMRKVMIIQLLSDSFILESSMGVFSTLAYLIQAFTNFILLLQKITFHRYYLNLIISLGKAPNHFHLLLVSK